MGVNVVFVTLLAVCCLYAGWRGGPPERIGAAIYAASAVLSHIAYVASQQRFRSLEVGILVVDIVVFLAFLLLSLRANRFWTLWVTGLLGVAIVGHVAMQASPHILPYAYRFVMSVWSYPILALIAGGTWLHQRRLRLHGADNAWSRSSRPPGEEKPTSTPTR